MENSMEVPLETKNRITIWSRNPTSDIYPGKTQKDTCNPVFTAALGSQSRHANNLHVHRQMTGVAHTDNATVLSHQGGDDAICRTGGPRCCLTGEVSQRQIHDITYTWNLKNWYKWTYLQNRLTDQNQIYDYQRGKGEGAKGVGIN